MYLYVPGIYVFMYVHQEIILSILFIGCMLRIYIANLPKTETNKQQQMLHGMDLIFAYCLREGKYHQLEDGAQQNLRHSAEPC